MAHEFFDLIGGEVNPRKSRLEIAALGDLISSNREKALIPDRQNKSEESSSADNRAACALTGRTNRPVSNKN
jgi:hypothetical protein